MSSIRTPDRRFDPAGNYGKSVNDFYDRHNSARPSPSSLSHTTRGTLPKRQFKFLPSQTSVKEKSFYTKTSGNSAIVNSGTIRTTQDNFLVDGVTLTLSGSTCWIYAWANQSDFDDNGIAFQNTEPKLSEDGKFKFVLAKATSSGGSYTIANSNILHDGDIILLSPLR